MRYLIHLRTYLQTKSRRSASRVSTRSAAQTVAALGQPEDAVLAAHNAPAIAVACAITERPSLTRGRSFRRMVDRAGLVFIAIVAGCVFVNVPDAVSMGLAAGFVACATATLVAWRA